MDTLHSYKCLNNHRTKSFGPNSQELVDFVNKGPQLEKCNRQHSGAACSIYRLAGLQVLLRKSQYPEKVHAFLQLHFKGEMH